MLLALVLAASPVFSAPKEAPTLPTDASGWLVDIGSHVGVVVAAGAAGTAVLATRSPTSPGLAIATQGFADLFTILPGWLLLASNPFTVLTEDFEGEEWGRAILFPMGLIMMAATPAAAAFGVWTAERLPRNDPGGSFGEAYVGALIGTVVALALDALWSKLLDPPETLVPFANWRLGLATSLISFGAAAGSRFTAPAPVP